MNRVAVNVKVLDLLSRFASVDCGTLMEEVSKVDARRILQSGVLVDRTGKVQMGQVGVMEALLTTALGGRPAVSVPTSLDPVKDALVLFLKLNNTDRFGFHRADTPQSWAFRIVDSLFEEFNQSATLSFRDRLVLLNVTENPVWQNAFTSALKLYLQITSTDVSFIQAVEAPAVAAAIDTFRSCLEARRERMPRLKYRNPLASFTEITEYAIGQYFNGQDLNDALSQSLVQAQLGTTGEAGKQRFAAFLKHNRITPDMFPTTAAQLYEQVEDAVRFKHTEEELSNILFLHARQSDQEERIEDMFRNFAEAVFPVAAKVSRMMSFSGLDLDDAASLLVRWLRESKALADVRAAGAKPRLEAVLSTVCRDELRDLLAFRSGQTSTIPLNGATMRAYVAGRTGMLPLNALNVKMQRVSTMLMTQMAAAGAFVARPGASIPWDMTFGIDEFFRTLRYVFRDIFEAADKERLIQTRKLEAFRRRFGPLPVISILIPRDPDDALPVWIEKARRDLAAASHFVFERRIQHFESALAL